jgi:hypothetical protein
MDKTAVGKFDKPTQDFQIGNPIEPGSRIVTVLPGSTLFQTRPWKGWRLFSAAITRSNFQIALKDISERAPEFAGSQNPADYALVEWHLNAEVQCGSGPAELGWSMRKAHVSLVPETQL